MLYRDMGKTGDKVSILGFGCMRLPKDGNKIDEAKSERLILSAIEQGVNYFDTAYYYRGSEATLGNILSKGYRDKVKIATKIPPIAVNTRSDMDKILDTQLKRLKTDHIDYFLMHMLATMDGWQKFKRLGAEDFLENAKSAGKIDKVCFSFHGSGDQFIKIIDDYPWTMAQIQYNYMDEYNQAGRAGLEYAASKGIGISVMEPLRGGALVNKLPKKVKAAWENADVKRSPAEWGLRWVWNHPGVSLLLSGMNEQSQLDENIRIASDAKPESLTVEELKVYDEVKRILSETVKVNCTGCQYCMPCPYGVNIPLCFSSYNNQTIHEDKSQRFFYLAMTTRLNGGKNSYASLCKDCGACEKKCPQGLPIRKLLKEVKAEMEPFYFKPASALVGGYMSLKNRNKSE